MYPEKSPPPPYDFHEPNYPSTDQKTPYHEPTETGKQELGFSSPSSSSCSSSAELDHAPPGWKVIHIYRDSMTSYSLVDASNTPLYTVSKSVFSTIEVRLLPHKSVVPLETNPPPYAAAKSHIFSSRIDFCLGDPESQPNPWDSMSLRRCGGFLHERWRWGMDPTHLPPELQIVHPGKKKKEQWEGQVEFLWRRPGDSAWKSGWELVIDRDGNGKGEVLARFKEPKLSLKKKGTLQLMDGLGRTWELLVFTTLNAVTKRETEQTASSCCSAGG